jgi:LEA14-like dessication related protein
MNDYHSAPRFPGYVTHWLRPIVLALLLTTTACSSLPRSTLAPDVKLESLSVVEVTADGQRFRLGLLLDNPNAYPLPIASLRFNVRLGGQGIMTGESRAPLTIPALGTETLRLEIDTDLVSSVSRLLALVQGPDDGIRYELNGRLVLASGMDRTLPFSVSGIVPLSATMGGR